MSVEFRQRIGTKNQPIKIVVVGDGAVGKTSLVQRFAYGKFKSEYVPTVFDEIRGFDLQLSDGTNVVLTIQDTAGQEDYERLRPIAYYNTHVFLICFNLVWPPSLENVTEIWKPEVEKYCPDAKIILVGTKSDLQNDPITLDSLANIGNSGIFGKSSNSKVDLNKPVSTKTGTSTSKSINASDYIEVSALQNTNVLRAFVTAAEAVLNRGRMSKHSSHKKQPNGFLKRFICCC